MKAEWSNKDSLEMPTTTMSDYYKAKDSQADWSDITLAIRAAVEVTVDKLNELQESASIKRERSRFE